MSLKEAALHSFLLVDIDTPARGVERLRSGSSFTHLVVRQSQTPETTFYYLIPRRVLRRIDLDFDGTLREILGLEPSLAVPVVSWSLSVSAAPPLCVIVDDDGQVFGFLDPEYRDLGPTRSSGAGKRVSGSLRAQFQDRMSVGQEASLLISLSPHIAHATNALRLWLPHGAAVEVVVEAEQGLQRGERREATLIFDSEHETEAVQFKIRARHAGHWKVFVYAYHEGQALGRLDLEVRVEVKAGSNRSLDDYFHESRGRGQEDDHRPSLDLHGLRSEEPDADLLIHKTWRDGREGWVVRLESRRFGISCRPAPVWFEQKPVPFIGSLLQCLQDLVEPTRQDLRNLGTALAQQVLPGEIRTLLWQHRLDLRTLHITSDETWIPWELCTLRERDVKGRVKIFGMLCERFEITRWHWKPHPTSQQSPWSHGYLITSPDPGLAHAFNSSPERLGLDRHLTWTTVPARRDSLLESFSRGDAQLIHYAGHAEVSPTNPLRHQLLLENNQTFTPVDLNGLAGQLGQAQPLVFLSGCRSGRTAPAPTGDFGFALAFLEVGASAFIGTRWKVRDDQAAEFARVFYRAIVGGRTLARAMRIARWVVARQGGATWMAFMLLCQSDAPPPLPQSRRGQPPVYRGGAAH